MVAVVLRAVGWPAICGVTAAAAAVGACGVIFLSSSASPALLAIAFVLLAAGAAFTLDEPASSVVDVTPTGPGAQTAVRSLALLVPLCAGLGLVFGYALRAGSLSWAAIGLALAGNVLLGFAIACVIRRRTGEPGAWAASTVAFILIAPSVFPPAARRIHTFPATAPHPEGLSSDSWWSLIGCACIAAIMASVAGHRLPKRRMHLPYPRVTYPPPNRPRPGGPPRGPARGRGANWPFLDRCHPAASDAEGPGGAPAAKRGRTTWRCGETTATLGREEGQGPLIKPQRPKGTSHPSRKGRRSFSSQRLSL